MAEVTKKEKSRLEIIATSNPEEKHLTFWVGGQFVGLPLRHVMRVISMQPIMPTPHSLPFCMGSIKLNEQVITIIDLRLFLGYGECENSGHSCIIICRICNETLGFAVENINAVSDIPNTSIVPPPISGDNTDHHYVIGVSEIIIQDKNELVLLIDPVKLLAGLQIKHMRTE